MVDGTLLFETGINNSGFKSGLSLLENAASVAIGNIATNIISGISNAMAQIPAQMVNVGSGFEAAMSQVAATSAITAVSEDYTKLSSAAKEMGATTQFSASQASEALNYLALAGYNADKSIQALPTILNVAASGGMELAAASDLITDAMSALGLQMTELETFSNKIAVAAQKSNASVSQMGEAILTVGGTAKTLTGGLTELTTMLGVLADNGIKGAEGGTALRNIILALSAPMNVAKDALNELNVKVFDSSGNMRLLTDIFADLNASLEPLTQEAKTQALNDIFNKVDLKSANALLGTSAERFSQLSGYIDDCDGAASQMAETMNDNLKGDITILNSGLEGLGIAAYEKFQVPMRTAVQDVTLSISELTESLTNGSLSNSFDSLSKGFSEIASGAVKVLASDIIPAVINGMETIIRYSDEIIAAVVGIGAAIAVIKIIPIITRVVRGIQEAKKSLALLTLQSTAAGVSQTALSGGLTLTEIAVALFTKQITPATAATALFKSEVFLAAAGTAALAALAAVTITAALAFKKYVDNMETAAAVDPWLEHARKQNEALEKERKAFEDIIATQKEKDAADEAQTNNIQKLWTELQTYVDKNGNVISSNERATEIIGTLSTAYGINIEYVNGQIQGYNELSQSMNGYIEKLRTEAKIRNAQPAYDEAITKQEEYAKKKEELQKKLNDKIAAYKAAETQDVKNVFVAQIAGLREELYTIENASAAYQETIDNYEGLFSQQQSAQTTTKSSAQMQAEEDAAKMAELNRKNAEELTEEQKKTLEKIEAQWKSAEHKYATGAITSESALYAEKQKILNKYGDASLETHWQYYEDLAAYQKRYAENAADEYEAQLQSEWAMIEHNESLGLISSEEAYKKRLEFIQKYCPEYSDEWYDYYKAVSDYQQEATDGQLDILKDGMQEQVDIVEDSLNGILKAYKDAYKELADDKENYKNKLLSVGDAFTVTENKDGSKTLHVNNLRDQIRQMKKYNEYVMKLKREGASPAILQELMSMDWRDGMAMAQSLSSLSKSQFNEINSVYNQREELAKSLSEKMYAPETDALNAKLKTDVTAEYDKLPAALKQTGAAAYDAFIEGMTGGDSSEQVTKFIDSLSASADKALEDMDFDSAIASKIRDIDAYDIGKQLGEQMADGFNSSFDDMVVGVSAEQAKTTAALATVKPSQSGSSAPEAQTKPEKIVIENKVEVPINVDGRQLATAVESVQNVINRERGL